MARDEVPMTRDKTPLTRDETLLTRDETWMSSFLKASVRHGVDEPRHPAKDLVRQYQYQD